MRLLARLNKRRSTDGTRFAYILRYTDSSGRRRCVALGHSDERKAERQRTEKEKELRMGYVGSGSMRLRDFVKDSLSRTGDQIRESTREEYESAIDDFADTVGSIDYQTVTLEHAQFYRKACFDKGNSPQQLSRNYVKSRLSFKQPLPVGS